MRQPVASPPFWRVLLAFAIAPGVAAIAFAVFSPLYEGMPDLRERIFLTAETTAWVVYPLAFAIGLPTYFWLRSRMRPSIINCVLVGAGVASLPWLILGVVVHGDEASVGNVITVHHGMMTLAGWAELLRLVGGIALLGGLAGAVFWLIAATGLGRSTSDQRASLT
jgi:hypothetical protein